MVAKSVITDIFPVPSLDKEYVTNGEIVLNLAAKFFEREYPGKECVGFRTKMDDDGGGFLYCPVMVDKQ